jgi:hypothetical protein
MFRVWTALAVSMTAGAVVLSWLEQGAPVAAGPPSTSALLATAHQAVADRAVSPRTWSGIVLVGVVGGGERSALMAMRPQDDVHFLLPTTGDVVVQSPWRNQRALDADGCIRVGLIAASPSGAASRTQLRALRALIDTLNSSVWPEGGPSLHILVDAGRGDQALMEAVVRQLRDILTADRA